MSKDRLPGRLDQAVRNAAQLSCTPAHTLIKSLSLANQGIVLWLWFCWHIFSCVKRGVQSECIIPDGKIFRSWRRQVHLGTIFGESGSWRVLLFCGQSVRVSANTVKDVPALLRTSDNENATS